MKKKVLSVILVMVMLVLVLTGCGLFSSGDNNEGDNNNANVGETNGNPLQITENYIVEAPEGLDYDDVYVVKCVPNGDNFVSEFSKEGMVSMWIILYGKGEKMVGEWDIYVLSDKKGVDKMLKDAGERAEHYVIPEADSNVMLWGVSEEEIEANVISYASYGMLNDPCSPADYAEFCADIYGGIVL